MQQKAGRIAPFLAGAAAVAVLISIAASQILLLLTLAALVLSDIRLRPPRRWWLAALFIAGTFASLAFSPDIAAGRPHIRKLLLFLVLPIIYSTFRKTGQVRNLILAWGAVGALSALVAVVQFARKALEVRELGADFYQSYVGERITGFVGHWMTFSGEAMMVLVLLAAVLLFGRESRRLTWAAAAAWTLVAAAIVFAYTRAVWFGAAAGTLYLLWHSRRRLLWAAPAVLAVMLAIPGVRARVISTVSPTTRVDSNQHRLMCFEIGVNMIKAHPLTGVGPEMVARQYREYLPPNAPNPLPFGWYGHLHNIYVQYAAERGLPTATVLTAWLIVLFLDFRRAALMLPDRRSQAKMVLHGAAAVVLAIMVEGLFEHNLGDSEILTMFLAVVAAGNVGLDNAHKPDKG